MFYHQGRQGKLLFQMCVCQPGSQKVYSFSIFYSLMMKNLNNFKVKLR